MSKKADRPLDYVAVPFARRHTLAAADDAAAGVALKLACFCAAELNGGRIVNCSDWTALQWSRFAYVDAPPTADAPGLWHWEGSDLVCDLYCATYEQKVLTRRATGRGNAEMRWTKTPGVDTREPEAADAPPQRDLDMPPHMPPHMQSHLAHARANNDIYNNNNKERGLVKQCSIGSNASPTPPTQFEEWFEAIAAAHPSCARTLNARGSFAPDVMEAALAAYARAAVPAANATLLRAYLSSKLEEDGRRRPFWRPSGQTLFWAKLEDVLEHALRWQRYTHNAGKTKQPRVADNDRATPEQMEAFCNQLKQLKNTL